MATPYLSEIRIFSFGFAPKGWALCNGQTLPINQNQALFALIGTFYGGNGTQTFNLPNLQGKVAVGSNLGGDVGTTGGANTHTLQAGQMPAHTHTVNANSAPGTAASPQNAFWAKESGGNAMYGSNGDTTLAPGAVTSAGGSQPHENMMPYNTLNFCIALQGIFPSRN
jgi:microcystin-dependent protein